jgi:hypothetical protein
LKFSRAEKDIRRVFEIADTRLAMSAGVLVRYRKLTIRHSNNRRARSNEHSEIFDEFPALAFLQPRYRTPGAVTGWQ